MPHARTQAHSITNRTSFYNSHKYKASSSAVASLIIWCSFNIDATFYIAFMILLYPLNWTMMECIFSYRKWVWYLGRRSSDGVGGVSCSYTMPGSRPPSPLLCYYGATTTNTLWGSFTVEICVKNYITSIVWSQVYIESWSHVDCMCACVYDIEFRILHA